MEKGKIVKIGVFVLGAALVGAAAWGVHSWWRERTRVATNKAELVRLGLPGDGTRDFMPLPAILPHALGAARLGSDLFIDRRLARTSRRTCNSCHWLNMGGSDGKLHGGFLTRPFENAAATTVFLHDGSLTNFSDAVRLMITDGRFAGGGTLETVVASLAADSMLMAKANLAFSPSGLNTTNLLLAIEQYGRTLLSAGRAYDRFQGGDANALSALEKKGYEAFRARKCINCHRGPVLGGHGTYEGRKITQLRGLGARRVYLADGSANDLGAALTRMPTGEIEPEERAALIAFLKTL